MRRFDIPENYKSNLIAKIKNYRKLTDPRKKDYSPIKLDFEKVELVIPRHFGFCYGVENAIEIAYKTLNENSGKKIYLLSEMIHNPGVNEDLQSRGVQFIMDTSGRQIIPWENLSPDDIVLIPAFGTTVDIENMLGEIGIEIKQYDTTCPFVEKVWNRANLLGEKDFTVVIHGKAAHEETRATFSHSTQNSHSIIVRNLNEAEFLSKIINGEIELSEFYSFFKGKISQGFDPKIHLNKIGVVNQTTMLASETQAIADLLKNTMIKKFGSENSAKHFADTRDTLCYATNDNQQATIELLNQDLDFALVVGGYNSSNTTHIVELLEQKFPVYFINDADNLISKEEISFFDIHKKEITIQKNFIPAKEKISAAITSGASCPDAVVDSVILKLLSFFDSENLVENKINDLIAG